MGASVSVLAAAALALTCLPRTEPRTPTDLG
jgi:hypothetical protein